MELKTRGFVLLARPYSETDKIVSFYTLHAGRVRSIAKGVRKSRSKLAAALELMTESDLVLHRRGVSDLYRLTQAKVLSGRPLLKKDLASITMLQVLADVLLQVYPESESHPEGYALVLQVLEALEKAEKTGDRERAFSAFALQLLILSGYPAELSVCAECGASLKETGAVLTPYRGGALCSSCAPGNATLRVKPAMRAILEKLASWPLSRIGVLKVSPALSRELFKTVMGYLEAAFEQPLKSFSYYLQVVPPEGRE